jgi:hypothetical protein
VTPSFKKIGGYMKINYLNYKPSKYEREYLESEMLEIKEILPSDSSFIINVNKRDDHIEANATIVFDKRVVETQMNARSIEILAPSLNIGIRAKMASSIVKNKTGDKILVA